MTIKEWFDSDPVKNVRTSMLGHKKNSLCTRCYDEESVSQSSRRHRSNQKSVIFTKSNFVESFQQSPHFDVFEWSRNNNGAHVGMPVDLHIDLGNYCNLTCKICNSSASSSIASQRVKWGFADEKNYIGTDWTRDQTVWNRVLEEIVAIPNLKNVHFMGGETLITRRFEEFIDRFISAKKFNVGFSFVTNGTIFNQVLLEKLKKFSRVGIEVSVETATDHNVYQRQGTDNTKIFENINNYINWCHNSDNMTVTIRPAISALTIGYYDSLLEFCLEKKLLIKSLICTDPDYYNPIILPDNVKQNYLHKYQNFLEKHYNNNLAIDQDFNESDPNEFSKIIFQQAVQCINLLKTPAPKKQSQLLAEMIFWCKKWDTVHGYNARELYPEFLEILDRHEY